MWPSAEWATAVWLWANAIAKHTGHGTAPQSSLVSASHAMIRLSPELSPAHHGKLSTTYSTLGQREKRAPEVDADSAGGHFESKWQPAVPSATFEQTVAAIYRCWLPL